MSDGHALIVAGYGLLAYLTGIAVGRWQIRRQINGVKR